MDKMHISGKFVEAIAEHAFKRWVKKALNCSMPLCVDECSIDLSGEAFEATLKMHGTIDDVMKGKILMALIKGT